MATIPALNYTNTTDIIDSYNILITAMHKRNRCKTFPTESNYAEPSSDILTRIYAMKSIMERVKRALSREEFQNEFSRSSDLFDIIITRLSDYHYWKHTDEEKGINNTYNFNGKLVYKCPARDTQKKWKQ